MIRIENLSKYYKEIHALNNISLHVTPGELFAYLGPNGAGKTTTIRILTGLTKHSSGNVYLNGFNIKKESLDAKRQCGLVPQSINLDQELTVYENLDIHGRLFHMPARKRAEKIQELLNYVDLADRQKSLAKQLSGGMKRRVMIARSMVHSPTILFLDEPTVGLDAAIRRKIWALIKKIQQTGTTIFLTTHYIEEAEFLANRVAFLDEGNIVAVDTPQNLMDTLGAWAIDRVMDSEMETLYFETREDAKAYIDSQHESFTFRRVNLEDAFLALTGKKVK
ncbi:putative ABC transporter, ATP-binding protein [Desulfonema limicola]|uniref:ABC transporter, ATP-binding protein n=1 Tax=Desulfonema limicola TaxID=45656 RepID=A0A975GHC3_9BACT|nr:ABC transporter ATP-binding protein [Desulfonema limicola]QTA81177.1 putative ABC transporter, ATP-binding protein [Desulfonema limicola]